VLHSDFVLAGRAAGLTPLQNLYRHLLPNVAPVFIVQLSWGMAVAVLAEAGLSYLGFGAPHRAQLGLLLKDLQQYISVHPLSVVWPGLAITITVLGLNLLGDALREATDPTLTRRRTAAQTHDGGDLMSLVVRNLSIEIDGRRVVDDVSFDVPDGARWASSESRGRASPHRARDPRSAAGCRDGHRQHPLE
jgi:hypothetical protein